MAPKANILADMFDTDKATEQVAGLESFKSAMSATIQKSASGQVRWRGPGNALEHAPAMLGNAAETQAAFANITKGLAGSAIDGLDADLAKVTQYLGDIQKDWTPSSPVGGTGLTPYDLEAPAKVLVPRTTPLRNSLPRVKGQGNSRKFKRIDSYTNAGVPGGAANASPFFSSLTNTSTWGGPGNLTLNRPSKIAYTGSDWSIGYVELGFSDSVDWLAQFQGLGFDDIRGLSQTALLWSHLLGEERAILYARGATSLGYSGTVAAPDVTATGNTSGGFLPDDDYFVYVVAYTGFGQSAPSTVDNVTVAGGGDNSITITVNNEVAGSIYYGLYVGLTTGIANATLQTTFVGNTYTYTTYTNTGAVGVNTDTSFSAASYDGYLTIQSDPTKSGYIKRVNGAWSTTTPGVEFDTALTTMYVNNGADPDEIWMTGLMRAAYSQLMRIGGVSGASSGYRTTTVTGDGSATIGAMVTGHANPATGKIVDVNVHRYMLPGAALIRSLTLPIPDSRVGAPVQMVNVQDYMGIQWPNIQMTYDASTYQIGTMEHVAPAWHGLLLGVTNGSNA